MFVQCYCHVSREGNQQQIEILRYNTNETTKKKTSELNDRIGKPLTKQSFISITTCIGYVIE